MGPSYSTNFFSVRILPWHKAFEVQLHCGVCISSSFLYVEFLSIPLKNIPHLLTQSPVGGCVGCFQFSAVMNNASMNIHTEICMQIWCFPFPWGKWVMNTHKGVNLLIIEKMYAFKKLAKRFSKEVIRDILLIQFNKRWLSFPRATLGLIAAREGEDGLQGHRVTGTNSTRPC